MKVYIRAALTVKQLETQNGVGLTKPVLKQIIEIDPTSNYDEGKGGKYCPWLIKQHKLGNLTPDDYTNVKDALELFSKDFRHYPNSDINQYKTVEQFLSDTNAVANRELTDREKEKLHGKQAHQAGDDDKEFLVADGDWEVWTPKTYTGSIALARMGGGGQADWCTAWTRSDNYYKSYTARGPLYIFLNKGNTGEKYQLHFQSDSWYDARDRSLGMDAFYDFIAKYPKFKEFFKVKSEGGVLSRAGSIIKYDPEATVIDVPAGMEKLPNFKFPDKCKVVNLPDSITEIPPKCFENCKVETVTFNNVTAIKAGAFRGSSIKNIDLSGVTHIGSSAFRDCKKLQSIDLNPEVVINSYSFAGDPIGGTVVVAPTMKLSMSSFEDCANLTIVWEKEDEPYSFYGIKELVLDPKACPELFEMNNGEVPIRKV